MRSKGSRWSIGNPLNRATAASSKASGAIRCFSRCSGTNCEGGCGNDSFPRLCLMEISQNETALKKTWFCGSRTAEARAGDNLESPDTSQRNSQVSNRSEEHTSEL